jgi:alkanesulfonate monooxygenase SsuD/methylene tetrahydromethanopterin reductase-like flavin-dependent oxidoreductase (luciferase family)
MEAMAAVPDRLVDEIALVGPAGRVRERVAAWKQSGVTDLIVGAGQPEALELLAGAV